MISAKQAAQKAAVYLQEIKSVYDVSLEEIELSDNERYWLVTLSYSSNSLLSSNQEPWKIFKVDAETGKVLSMKSRE